MDFFDIFGIAAIMSVRDYYRDVDRQKQKAAQFYQKCREEIADEIGAAFELIQSEAERANPNFIPNEIVLGGLYLGLYGCGLVLQVQPSVSAEQDKLLTIMFRSLSFSFTKEQFIAAMRTRAGVYQQFIDVIGITESKAGSFWVAFFKTLYKNGTNQKLLTDVMNHFSNIVMRFAILGHPNSQVALPIIERAYKAVDHQVVACRNLPDDDVDFIGLIPYAEHFSRLNRLFDSLLLAGKLEEHNVEPDFMNMLFDHMLLNNISELVMAGKLKTEQKIRIIDEVLDNLPFRFSMDAAAFLNSKANDPSFHSFICDTIVTTNQKLGMVWHIILICGEKSGRQQDCISLAKEYVGMMLGIDSELSKRYPLSGFGSIAREQVKPIINGMGNMYA